MKTIHTWALAGMACLALAGRAPNAHAQVFPQYPYQSDRIYQVRTGLGITTQVELSPHEKILDYSTGFSNGWDITRRENVFYLKPRNVDVDTNMIIRTKTHTYVLELKVVATDWTQLDQAKRAGVQYKIRFTYPTDASFNSEADDDKPGAPLDTTLAKERVYHFDYDYAARRRIAPWLVPVNVYDDGQFTYIKMSDLRQFPTADFPALFMREKERGDDATVNTSVEGNTIVVHGTYPYLVIRHGDNVIGLRRNARK